MSFYHSGVKCSARVWTLTRRGESRICTTETRRHRENGEENSVKREHNPSHIPKSSRIDAKSFNTQRPSDACKNQINEFSLEFISVPPCLVQILDSASFDCGPLPRCVSVVQILDFPSPWNRLRFRFSLIRRGRKRACGATSVPGLPTSFWTGSDVQSGGSRS